MIIPLVVLIAIAALALAFLLRRGNSTDKGISPRGVQARSLEEKLAIVEACGLHLDPPFTVDDLLSSWSRAEYEKPGYDMVLVGLGMTEEQPPWRNRSTNLWHFDTEAIEDHGDYKRIVERLVGMTQGSLVLEDLQDYVDVEQGVAWVSFTFKGKSVRIDFEVQDDWVDTSIFGYFVAMLGKADPSKIYVYRDLGGQDCIIGCVTRENFDRLNNNGVSFLALT